MLYSTKLAAVAAVAALPAMHVSAAALPAAPVAGEDMVGGTLTQPNAFPFVVSINTPFKGEIVSWCGGALINANTLVTAAHCSHGRLPEDFHVRIGSVDFTTGGTLVGVKTIRNHPKFSYDTGDFDLSLWQLDTPVKPSANIAYVALPPQNVNNPPVGIDTIALGWGVIGYDKQGNEIYPNKLHQIHRPVAQTAVCQAAYNGVQLGVTITPNMFCTGTKAPGPSACNGDNGGPLINAQTKNLIGIQSMGPGKCGGPDHYDTFVRIPKFVDWINQNKF